MFVVVGDVFVVRVSAVVADAWLARATREGALPYREEPLFGPKKFAPWQQRRQIAPAIATA
jgi:hypothetical protein